MNEFNLKIWELNLNYKKYYNSKNEYTILILHWWWWSSDSWLKVWELLFQKWYNIIIPDLPWFWKTKIDKVYNLDDYANLIEKFIKKLELNNLLLWGHSNWWSISIKLANRWILKISRLILNNSAWIRNDRKRNFKRTILNNLSNIFKKISSKSNNCWTKCILILKIREIFYKIIWWQDYINSEKNPFLKQTYLNMISSDLTKEIQNININTLLIWWENDSYTPISDWKKMKELIINSKFVMIKNQKHWIHLLEPKLLVNTFLNNI